MPVSKKPRRKRAGPAKATVLPPLPDRRAMEGVIARMFGSSGRHQASIDAAQSVMYDAWEATGGSRRTALARKALQISPLCADAYVLLAEEEAGSIEEALAYYRKGLEAGEQVLGPEGFEEYAGSFWGFHETRPYMRARAGLAATLWALGYHQEAIDHYRAMLGLNPNDNQGIRYVLAGHLLERNDMAALKELLAQYQDDGSAMWLYTQALVAFREKRPDADRLAQEACRANAHVPRILAGSRRPVSTSHGYITMGGEDEASDYVADNGEAWRATPGAIEWLVETGRTLKPRRPRRDPMA